MPAPVSQNFTIYYLSEQAVTLEFGHEISETLLQRITGFAERLQQKPFPGFYTVVPAYSTLSIFYDPIKIVQAHELPGKSGFEKVSNYLMQLDAITAQQSSATHITVTIPVCYGGTFGPDLDEVAQIHQLTPQEVINLHSNAIYTVYMIGFIPGFAYLGGMPEILTTPRKTTPRKAVPAGAVGIAGAQTGIYPLQTPGGWQLIGQTPLRLFQPERTQPSLLKAGDRVAFKPIRPEEFNFHTD